MKRVTNISDLTSAGAVFVDGPAGTVWSDFSGLPANSLERRVTKPRLSRIRAAFQGVAQSAGHPIISHLPGMTTAVVEAQAILRNRSPHLAFSFNFTDLPVGFNRLRMTKAFARVVRFCVYSAFERKLYSDYFKIPPERFVQCLWAQRTPVVSSVPATDIKRYVCAIGGEGRDYATLIEAARKLPDLQFILVVRPHSIQCDVPSNVEVRCNVESSIAWRLAVDSILMVLPLRSEVTCCGQITLVSAEQLGIPIVTSTSHATSEYTEDCILYSPGDPEDLAQKISLTLSRVADLKNEAMARRKEKIQKYRRENWEGIVSDFLSDAWSEV